MTHPTVRVKQSGGSEWLDASFPITDEQLARGFEKSKDRIPNDGRYSNAVRFNNKYYVPRFVLKYAIEEEVRRRFHLGYDDFKIENTENALNAFRDRGWNIQFIKRFDWSTV